MIELLVAYLLWEGEAPAQWWGLYVAVIVIKIYMEWQRQREIKAANAEADRVVKKLFEDQWK